METIFLNIYDKKIWGSCETISGSGSTDYQTKQIQFYIVLLIQKYKINTLFDVPCGDFNWFKNIVDHIPNYIGGDIVKKVIETNREKYNKSFIQFDITTDRIPEGVDLIFCRDLFVHLPLTKIIQAFENIKKSSAKYIIMTTFNNRAFNDVNTGGWRPISFFDKPFSFPKPLELISENCSEFYPQYIDKSIGLWRIEDIPNFIPLKIFRTWHTKDIPVDLQNSIDEIKRDNPQFEHYVYDTAECEYFIQEHFDKSVVDAYNTLIPLAYKADLWRLCVLYIYGGIYLDISFKPINGFRFFELIDKEYFSTEVRLKPYANDIYKGVSNGLIATYPKNNILLKTINKMVENIQNRYYGESMYDITGAILLGSFFTLNEKKGLNLHRVINGINGYSLNNRNIVERIASYDTNSINKKYKGVNGSQTYIESWYNKTVYSKK